MKKLVFVFATFAAISFASCGNKAANNNAESTAVAEETVIEKADSCCNDSTKACCNDSTATCCDSTQVAVAE